MSSPEILRTPDGMVRLVRPVYGRVLAGVAAGVAAHLRLPVGVVRAAFVVLSLMAGAGVVAYALLWIFVPQLPSDGPVAAAGTGTVTGAPGAALPRAAGPAERRQAIGIAALGVAILIAALALGVGRYMGALVAPLAVVAIGGAFLWREADETRRERWRRTAAGFARPGRAALWRIVGGIALVIGGLAVFAVGQLDFAAARSALIAVLLTLVGVAVITVPWLARLVRDLGAERRERIRQRERAEVAAHLHDSVLQTLALIQRQSTDPREVQRLARSQERELRSWLYGPAGYASEARTADDAGGPGATGGWTEAWAGAWGGGWPAGASTADTLDNDGGTPRTASYPGSHKSAHPAADPSTGRPHPQTLAVALAQVSGEVEDAYAITIEPVVVGDAPMTPHLAALVAAAREAMVNAAKHAGVQEVSVYGEVESGTASVFVRDRGSGFDPTAVSPDRRGLAESIRGRMQRHGGTAQVRSSPGSGTEIVLSVPVLADAVSADAAD